MASTADIVAKLTLNAKDFTAQFDGAVNDAANKAAAGGQRIGTVFSNNLSPGLEAAASRVPVLGSALTALSGGAFVAVAAGATAVAGALALAIGRADEFEKSSRQLDAVLKATGNQTGLTGEQLKTFAADVAASLQIPVEAVLKAEQSLATFSGVTGTTFKETIKLAGDLAAVMGGTLESNATKLGATLQKVAEGDVKGLANAYKFLDAQTIANIQSLSDSGKAADAVKASLAALQGKVSGSGEAANNNTVSGAFFKLGSALGEVSQKFVVQTGLYAGVVLGLNASADAAKSFADQLGRVTSAQIAQAAANPGQAALALGRYGYNSLFSPPAAPAGNGSLAFKNDPLSNLDKFAEDRAAATAAQKLRDGADTVRAAEDAVKAAEKEARAREKAATEAQRAAEAVERQRQALAASIEDLKFQSEIAGKTREQQELLTKEREIELRYGKLVTIENKKQIEQYISIAQIKRDGRKEDDDALKELSKVNEGFLENYAKKNTEWLKGLPKQQKKISDDQLASFRYLSDTFYDIFSGRSGNIWNKFKELGARTLAELAAQFVLTGSINLGGTSAGGLLGAIGGAIGGGKSGLIGNLGGGIAGALGLGGAVGGLFSTGLGAVTISGAAASAAGVGALGGTTLAAAGAGAGSLAGIGTALAAAAPWLAAIAGLGALAAAIIPGITPRAFQNISSDSTGGITTSFGGARGKGKDESLANAKTITETFETSLQSILATFGGKIAPNAFLGNLGIANGKYGYSQNPSDVNGYSVGAPGQAYDSAEAAVTAALQSVLSRGLVTGVDATITKLLSSGDFATQSAKAVLLSSALKEFNNAANPGAEAVRTLTDQFTTLRDIMLEAGSSAADLAKASDLYDTKLQAIKDSTGQATSTLRSFLDSLGFGSNSPLSLGDQRDAAVANYQKASAGIGSAGFDQSAFTAAGQVLLDIEGQIFGRTQDFFTVFRQVQEDTTRAIAGIDNAASITGDNPFARRTADSTAATADNTAALLQSMQDLPAQIAAAVAQYGGGGGGVFVGGDNRNFVV